MCVVSYARTVGARLVAVVYVTQYTTEPLLLLLPAAHHASLQQQPPALTSVDSLYEGTSIASLGKVNSSLRNAVETSVALLVRDKES